MAFWIRITCPQYFPPFHSHICVHGSGFPDSLLALKARVAKQYPSLPKESPGSLWPKTTLGALKDGRRLTPTQLQDLIVVCK